MVAELKIDPDNQQPYTFEALKEKYAGHFPADEIEAYWEEDCTALPADQCLSGHRKQCEQEAHPEPSQTEMRIDPEDGISYFFEDFVTKNENHFTKAELIDYWFEEMRIDFPDGTKLFVSNLRQETGEEQLHACFAPFGELVHCEVHGGAAEASKGFATLQYMSIQAAEQALAAMNGTELDGAKLVVRELLDRQQNVSVYVGAIPKGVAAEELEQAFSACGEVVNCSVFNDPGCPSSKGQARIDFIFPKSVQQAVDKFHAKAVFNDQRIVVMPWREDDCGRRLPGPTVFVRKVSPETSEQRVRELFENIGIIVVNVMLFKNRDTLQSCGIGKVEMADEASVQRAMRELHGVELDGSPLILREFSPPGSQAEKRHAIFVSGLSTETTVDCLNDFFGGAGELVMVTIMSDWETGKSKGSAKILYKDDDGFRKALTLNGAELNGRKLFVREYLPMHQAESAPQNLTQRGGRTSGPAVFISNLSLNTTSRMLKTHFEPCGQILDAVVFPDHNTGQSRGVGKVSFASEDAMLRAIQKAGTELDGRPLHVREFTPQANFQGARGGDNGAGSTYGQDRGKSVFVSGMSLETTCEALRNCFSEFGEVTDVLIYRSKDTGKSRGLGRVKFASEEQCKKALQKAQQVELDGRRLFIRLHEADRLAVSVSNLSQDTTTDRLLGFFKQYVEVRDCRMHPEREGFARVEFVTDEAKQYALRELNGARLDGRTILVQEFGVTGQRASSGYAVFVGGIAADTSGEMLMEHFRQCGEAVRYHFLAGRDFHSGRKAARMEFRTPEERERAIKELNLSTLDAQTIVVREFTSQAGNVSVFVSGLAPETTNLALATHFRTVGEVKDCKVYTDNNTGQSRCVGRVDFTTEEAQQRAVEECNGTELDGSLICVRRHVEAAQSVHAYGSRNRAAMGVPAGSGTAVTAHAIYVSCISLDTSVVSLRRHFEDAGRLRDVRLILDKVTRKPTGAACLEFADEEGQRLALREWDSTELDGQLIRVREFHPRQSFSAASRPMDRVREVDPEDDKAYKVDPEDGKVCTFKELQRRAREAGFTDQEIVEYWRDECQPVKQPAPSPADAASPAGPRALATAAPAPAAAAPQAVAAPPPASGGQARSVKDMSLKDWVDAMDSNGVRNYLAVLEEQFDSLEQIITLYLKRGGGPNGTNVFDDGFFEDVGINKIGQRRVVNKWVAANT